MEVGEGVELEGARCRPQTRQRQYGLRASAVGARLDIVQRIELEASCRLMQRYGEVEGGWPSQDGRNRGQVSCDVVGLGQGMREGKGGRGGGFNSPV